MVAKEFLIELQTIRDAFEWKLAPDTHRTPERRFRPRLHIRGISKTGPAGFLFDPIGALCYARTGHLYSPHAWLEAASAIDLSLIDASDLIAAANDRSWVDTAEGKKPSNYVQRLRERLAATVGLRL
jgi:hypothetical protein